MMMDKNDNLSKQNNGPVLENSRKKQQQSDPQITELKGYIDPNENLEPEIEDEIKDAKNEEGKL